MRLYLIRHGAVTPPRPRMYYGGSEVPLSPVGEEQARLAARMLARVSIDHLVCSPLSRARFGAEQVLDRHPQLELQIEPRLREIDRGGWVGLTPEEIEAEFPGQLEAHAQQPEDWRGHGGESRGDLRDRVLSAKADLLREHPGRTVVLVAHMFPIRALVAEAEGLDLFGWDSLEIPTGSVSLLEYPEAGAPIRVHWIGRREEAANLNSSSE